MRLRSRWLSVLAVPATAGGLTAQTIVDLPADDRLLSATLDQVYRIGSAGATAAWEQFSAIEGVGFDEAGNLYLLDTTEGGGGGRVVVVDSSGEYVHDFGREGGGPGEFSSAAQIVVWPDGRVLVEDVIRPGYHVFRPGGDFERTVREPGTGTVRRPRLRPDRTRPMTLVGMDEGVIARVDMSGEEVTDNVLVEPWNPTGMGIRRVATGEGDRFSVLPSEWGFKPDILLDVLPSGGIAYADSSSYAVKVTDPGGVVVRILRRPIRPLPVTEAMKRAVRERRLAVVSEHQYTRAGGGGVPPQLAPMLDGLRETQMARVENMQFFPEVPVLSGLRTTWEGTLWVQRSTAPESEETGPIDVLSPEGRYLGTLAAAIPMPHAFGPNGLVAFLDADAFDVPVITVRRLDSRVR